MGFYSIRAWVWVNFSTMGLLMGKKLDPMGLWAWVWECSIQTRKPMGFVNPVHDRKVVYIYPPNLYITHTLYK